MTKVLYLYGGWPGHFPYEVANWAKGVMSRLGFDVEETAGSQPPSKRSDQLRPDCRRLDPSTTTEDLSDRSRAAAA